MKTPSKISRREWTFHAHFTRCTCGIGAHSITFTHHFTLIAAAAGCHGPGQGVTRKAQRNPAAHGKPGAGWGRRGGGLQCRNTYLRRAHRAGDGVRYGFETVQSILGTGGANILQAEGEDCQVPSRRLCLSLRSGAAGPEWRWAPRARTLTLGHSLEQPNALNFSSFGSFSPSTSERTHSARQPQSGTRETPFPFGTVSRSFWGHQANDRLSAVEAGL